MAVSLAGVGHMLQTQEMTGPLSLPDAGIAAGRGFQTCKKESVDKSATLCDSMSASSHAFSQAVLDCRHWNCYVCA